MTKEELKKEAEEWLSITDNHLNDERTHFLSESEYAEQAYLVGAEPREKRIAELEDKIRSLEGNSSLHEGILWNDIHNQDKKIAELEKENKVLAQNLEDSEIIIAGLKAQIEKMKNWCNCKNYQKCLFELAEQGKGMKPSECCVNCKKWEIKEK